MARPWNRTIAVVLVFEPVLDTADDIGLHASIANTVAQKDRDRQIVDADPSGAEPVLGRRAQIHAGLKPQESCFEVETLGAQDGLTLLDIYHARYDAARERMEAQLEVDASGRGCMFLLALVALLENDEEAAHAHLVRVLTIPGDPTVARLRLAAMRWKAGERAEAERLLDMTEPGPLGAIREGSEWWGPRWSLTAIVSIRDDLDAAVAVYEDAYRAGRRDYRWDGLDPLFENARRDPRFVAILEAMEDDVQSLRARIDETTIPLPLRRARTVVSN